LRLVSARRWRACCLGLWGRGLAALLARLAPMPLRRRGARIVELVGLAVATDAAHGRPGAVFDELLTKKGAAFRQCEPANPHAERAAAEINPEG
jgi:hypothetical protein